MSEEPRGADVWPKVDIWPEVSDLRQRFDEIQAEFIEQPRHALKKAERLVDEAIDRVTRTMRDRSRSIHSDAEGTKDTEQLRLAMQRYRAFIDSLGKR